jgi:hypothetical protein
LKPILLVAVLGTLLGCGQNSSGQSTNKATDSLTQKLNSMPASERAKYAKAHMDEIMKSAHPAPGSK